LATGGADTGGKLPLQQMDEPRKQNFFTMFRFSLNKFVPLKPEMFE
jgi:hypothetical protein